MQIEELLSIKIMYSQLQEGISSTHEALSNSEKLKKHLNLNKQFIRHRLPKNEVYDQLNVIFQELTDSVNNTLLLTASSLEKLSQTIYQDKHIIDNIISSLLEDTKKLLMQPFSTILEVFPRMVRDIAGELKKEINLEIEGEAVEIDRRILEEMKDPLTHMIRNSIDHGIETPEEREKAGKPKVGVIKIAITAVGSNHVDMVLSDDGKGFPFDRIKAKAISEGAITASESESMQKEDIIKLAFQSGVSSAEIITELSGRGLGLGIMSEKIEKLGGSYSIQTEDGKGTSVHISLPLTVATFRGIQIISSDREFIIPSQGIQRIIRQGGYEISTIENQKVVFLDNKNYPFQYLSDLLALQSNQEQNPNLILLLSSGSNELAIGIDRIIDEQEIFVKGLGKQLEHVPNISAATIMEGGRIIPVLDVMDLIKTAIQTPNRSSVKSAPEGEVSEGKKNILVAEDTMTTRLLFKNILGGAGYNVITASDGAEAFDILLSQKIDLLVTDIEMPRLTGFELVAKVHGEEKLKDLPIIIITARESVEDKKRGIELGVDAYIEKSSFVQKELISIIKKLL